MWRRLAALGAATLVATTISPVRASTLVFTGIRPGTWLRIGSTALAKQGTCTANFVFQTEPGAFHPDQQLYLGTAGHCGKAGDVVRALIVAPGEDETLNVRIGTVARSTAENGIDFALIAIDPALNDWVSPSAAHVGGPTGIYAGGVPAPIVLTGNGTGVGPGGTVRPGVLTTYDTTIHFVLASNNGDSGSPVLTPDGLAVGELTTKEGFYNQFEVPWVRHYGPSIGSMVTAAGLPLATCPTATPWPLPGCPPV